VPFFKRAQIAAADLHLIGVAPAGDIDRLTLFADNLVPHVLRLDGILEFDPELVEQIEAGRLLEHGSPPEVEIRACALHAVELLVAAHGSMTATAVDNALWNRGALARYKARPRHRARSTAY
jgi:Potential Queuosine, Q, salvage protein family